MIEGESYSTKTGFVAPAWRHRFGSPGELMAAILCEELAALEGELGRATADRIRTGHPTVRDLILAALWMGASPVEMWPAVN